MMHGWLLSVSPMLLFLLLLSLQSTSVHGWGKQGHEIVGNLAWMLLSKDTQAIVADILNITSNSSSKECNEFCSPLAAVADWADIARNSAAYHWSGPLHYIDVRDDLVPGGCPVSNGNTTSNSCLFDYARDCTDDICVAGAIVNYTSKLIPDTERKLRRESLMFLTHFVGDIHQPLHCGRDSDRGGNSIHVRFGGDSGSTENSNSRSYARSNETFQHDRRLLRKRGHHALNLHAVWDSNIIEATLERDHKNSRNALEVSLLKLIWKTRTTPAWNNVWLKCADGGLTACTSQWAEESLEYALMYAYRNVDGKGVIDGTDLTDGTYYETRLPIVRERLAVAGVRLAVTLESTFVSEAARQVVKEYR